MSFKLNVSQTAKVDKKTGTIKVLVECDNTERLFIATFCLLDVADEMEEIFNASEPNYKEMPDFQDLDYHEGCNDNLTAIENLLEKGNLDLTPYYEPTAVKTIANPQPLYLSLFGDGMIHTYGFIERSDFGSDEVIFIY